MFGSYLPRTLVKVAGLAGVGSAGLVGWNLWGAPRRAVCEAVEIDTTNIPRPTRTVKGVAQDKQDFHVTLFQYQTCPFCSKVRAYMDYYGLGYDVVEVNPLFRSETKFSTYRKIPFVLYNDHKELRKRELLLPDSSLIVSLFQTARLQSKSDKSDVKNLLQFYPEHTVTTDGKEKKDFANKYYVMYEKELGADRSVSIKNETKWRQWVDETLVHTLAPNIYQSPSEAVRTFKYLADAGDWEKIFPSWQVPVVIYVGASMMYVIGKRLKKRYGLKDNVRISMYEACDDWVRAVGDQPYLGGAQPNLADLATYGVLSAIEGCDAFVDLAKNTKILPWFKRMKAAVNSHHGANSLKAVTAA
ncbi:Prostaglandin E synthase 2 [Hypsibius exemplaris]|uniref:Prostaglandin E synthase 2 n=1 Tax=Hypsibius exemplaris TaxID=2072580 RepID=A0A1W0WKE9_HYPEX|nr:Prostaglandin E synthase 2 [Hypsibius exemplaris]